MPDLAGRPCARRWPLLGRSTSRGGGGARGGGRQTPAPGEPLPAGTACAGSPWRPPARRRVRWRATRCPSRLCSTRCRSGRCSARCPPRSRGLTDDSRRVEPGDCFVAVPGFKQDARRFVPDAVARGARRGGHRGRAACPDVAVGPDPGAGHPAGAGAAGRRLLRPSLARPHPGRHHRHQRQDDDLVPGRGAAARPRPRHRHHRHDPVRASETRRGTPARRRRRRSSSRGCSPRWWRRGRRRGDGGLVARARRSTAWTASTSTWPCSPT